MRTSMLKSIKTNQMIQMISFIRHFRVTQHLDGL